MPINSPFKALIVDDSDDLRRIIARGLSAEGIECHEAADGVVAGNLMRTRRFDLVTLDLVMPRVNGHKLAVELLSTPNPPIIVIITGATDGRIARDLLARGVADILYKPIQVDLMSAKLKALLERAKAGLPSAGAAHAAVSGRAGSEVGEIAQATEFLRNEFARVTASFERTIQQLEEKKSDLQSDFIKSVQLFISLMDRKGHAGTSHAGRVERACSWISDELGLSADQRHELQVAAVLHEIGQFGMPDFVRLKRPWELTPEEREVYEKYPIMGATLLSEIKGAERIAETIELHAENFSGNGFPHRRAGEDIPLAARVLRLADGIDTFQMYSAGPCQREDIVMYLTQKRGALFDPALVPLGIGYLAAMAEQAAAEENNSLAVPANEIPIGAQLLANVYDAEGRFLARAGAEVRPALASRLGLLLGATEVRIHVPQKSKDSVEAPPKS